jgi:hypothetical protein
MSEIMNITDLQKLASDWLKIKHFLQTKNKLDYPMFKSTFEKTYDALLECRGAEAIDKKYMKLIVNAYNFINTSNNSLDDIPQAAFVLTERMLNCCIYTSDANSLNENMVSVYVLEDYQEISLDFNNVDKSMEYFLDKIKDNIDWGVWCFGHYHADRIERPRVEQFYTDYEDINVVWNRFHGKKTYTQEWWLPKSPYMSFWENTEEGQAWLSSLSPST